MAPSDNGSTGMGELTGAGSGLPEFEEQNPLKKGRVHLIKQAIPSWLVSTFVHVAAILVLGAWNIEPIKKELKLMLSSAEALEDGEDLQATAMEEASASELQPTDSADVPSDVPAVDSNIEATSVDLSQVVVDVPLLSMNSMASLTPKNAMAAQANATMKQALTGRSKETKRDLLRKFGGSDATEKAVSMALKWLAEHQNKQNGSWTLAHGPDNPGNRQSSFNAATGMALMCFLGAGQTHMEGEYKEVVFGGLSFLIKNMKFQKGLGSWYVGGGSKGLDDMYAHGIATIALCEAYGMTRDPALVEAAQSGINFLDYAQNPTTGGWHYSPKGLGDTSVVGWQMMALKSAAMSGLTIDLDVVRRANLFLDAMSWEEGTSYHYSFDSVAKKAKYNASCTACALLCRMYSGMKKDHPTVKAIVAKFDKAGPSRTGTYYNYYATQVMKQYGGPEWDRWNVRMRDQLIGLQSQSGPSTGSWYWEDGHSTASAGRFYTTCMATMILEVYYRYLPIYAEQGEEDAFEL